MLTNEEALRLIKQCDECYVVWATDRNMIVSVRPIPANTGAEERIKALEAMGTEYSGPTKGRFLSSRNVTLRTLQDEQAETGRIATRQRIFNAWRHCSIDELIAIVVEMRFSGPMDAFHGSSHIIERLYKIHGPRLTQKHLAGLEQFAQAGSVPRDQRSAQEKLQCFLTVLQNDHKRLKEFWERHYRRAGDWAEWGSFTDAAGDLPTRDLDIIAHLIEVVERPFMFGPRFEAMVALGKIGPASGKRAVDVIQKAIHDSSDSVTAVRNCVIARILRSEDGWTVCRDCFHGYVDGANCGIPSVHACNTCSGLGHVPRDPI